MFLLRTYWGGIGLKGAIFDVDGTLIDSMVVWTNSTLEFYKKRGLPFTEEEFSMFRSMTLTESLPYIKRVYGLEESVEEILAEFEKIIFKEYKYSIPIKPYADTYLKQLKSDGVKLAVATSTKAHYCEAALSRLGILDCFDAIAYSDEVGVSKKEPDVYLLAANRIGILPSDCTVFEDISTGILSAKKAGFKTVSIYDECNVSETEILKKHSDKYIISWKELLKKG